MDGLYATFVILIFTVPSIVCILMGSVLLLKKKSSWKLMFAIGFVGLAFPWILFNTSSIFGHNKFIGEYHAVDEFDNQIEIELRRNVDFQINVKPCSINTIHGTWEYIDEFASILIYVDGYDVEFYLNRDDEYELESDISSECCNLTRFKVEK
jgi:hypothetical protein